MSNYLVLGPGRCGTSTVARLLHTKLNISMGEHFRLADRYNVNGYFEDLEFKNPNEFFIKGSYSFKKWNMIIQREIEKRERFSWGLKDPRLCYLLGFYLCYIENPIFIRCRRELKKIANSLTKCYGWSYSNAIKVIKMRELFLDRILKNRRVLDISFDNFKTDEEIVIELEDQI